MTDTHFPIFYSAPLAKEEPSKPQVDFYDLRDEQVYPIPKSRVRQGKTVMRKPSEVNGITIHQMGIVFGISDAQLKASNGNYNLAKARRFLNVPAHANVSMDGFWMIHSPLEAYLSHANGLNGSTLGLEIEGLYEGREVRNELTAQTEEAARIALKYLVDEGRKMGMPIDFIYAHRQSSATRRADPGAEIWQKIVLGYAIPELGLQVKNSYINGDGRAIPKEWDPIGSTTGY